MARGVTRTVSKATAVLLLAATVLGCATTGGGQGRPDFGTGRDVLTQAQTRWPAAKAYVFGGMFGCSRQARVRITAVRPHRTVGGITIDAAGLYGAFITPPTDLVGSWPGPLPARYRPVGDTSLPDCPAHGDLAIQVTRHGPQTAGILGLDVDFLDEKGGRHTVNESRYLFVLCGEQPNQAITNLSPALCPHPGRSSGRAET